MYEFILSAFVWLSLTGGSGGLDHGCPNCPEVRSAAVTRSATTEAERLTCVAASTRMSVQT